MGRPCRCVLSLRYIEICRFQHATACERNKWPPKSQNFMQAPSSTSVSSPVKHLCFHPDPMHKKSEATEKLKCKSGPPQRERPNQACQASLGSSEEQIPHHRQPNNSAGPVPFISDDNGKANVTPQLNTPSIIHQCLQHEGERPTSTQQALLNS